MTEPGETSFIIQRGPPGKVLVIGGRRDSEPLWLTRARARLEHLQLEWQVSRSFEVLPRPMVFDFLIVDFENAPPEPDPTMLKQLTYLTGSPDKSAAMVGFSLGHGPWLPLAERAEVVIARDRACLFGLLDRDIRALVPGAPVADKPPEGYAGPGLAAELFAELAAQTVRAMAERKLLHRPAVSFVVPVFNTPRKFLSEMIESVLDQKDPDWELVLLDNGDPAVTAPVIGQYTDPRIRHFDSLGRRGIANGRNLGNLLARGRIIAVLDHDDMAAPERAGRIRRTIKAPDQLLYSDVVLLHPSGELEEKKLRPFSEDELRQDCNIYHPSVAYSWELAAESPYDPRFQPSDDYRFYLSCLRRGKRLVHHSEPHLVYRVHGGQHSRQAGARLAAVSRAARKEHGYLRGGGDPFHMAERTKWLVTYLAAFGEDDSARELIALGYGGREQGEVVNDIMEGRASAVVSGKLDDWTRLLVCWVMLNREGTERALSMMELLDIESDPWVGCDRAELLYRTGRLREALEAAIAISKKREAPALSIYLAELFEAWRRRCAEGKSGEVDFKPEPPRIEMTPADAAVPLSLVVAGRGPLGKADVENLAETAPALPDGSEVFVFADLPHPELASRFPRAGVTIGADGRGSLPARYNIGLSRCRGQCVMLLEAGDLPRAEYINAAMAKLMANPEAGMVMGRVVSADGKTMPDRGLTFSSLSRYERAFLSGAVFRREAFDKIGGFMEALEEAAEWELLLRAVSGLEVVQLGAAAGRKKRASLEAVRAGDTQDKAMRRRESFLLAKLARLPLRHGEVCFAGRPHQEVNRRLDQLWRLVHDDPDVCLWVDPWEYMAEHNDPHHYLHRQARELQARGLARTARRLLTESITQKPHEPKLWFKYFGSFKP